MGKSRDKHKKMSKGKSSSSSSKERPYNAEDLLNRVESYVDNYQFELALKFAEKALALDPSNMKTQETIAGIYAELGDLTKAKETFLKVVEQKPSEGHEKYMYLGQLAEGKEAVKFYLKGIEIIKQKKTDENVNQGASGRSTSGSSEKGIERLISDAYCSLAEIFLTDCCFEENAEEACETYCQEAIKSDSNNPEAYVVMANFLLSQENKSKAKEMAVKSVNLWLPVDHNTKQDNCKTDEHGEETANQPSYESRFNISRILIETEEYDKAESVIEGLLEENDEDINLWYLLGWTSFLRKEIENAKFVLTKAKKMYEKFLYDDQELLDHMNELLKQCEELSTDVTDSEDLNTDVNGYKYKKYCNEHMETD